MRDVHHDVAEARAGKPLEVPGDERLSRDCDQSLRHRVGERAQAFAAARRKQHRLHFSISSSSFASGASGT
jgi:hypothetical protein